ncbi:MAG: pentapeptide repeat-containing protein, partial [Kovacikia sp.]
MISFNMTQNFSAKNLRGRSFKGQDLTGANFSGADLRSADFSNTILRGANFSGAKAGLQKRWVVGHLIVSVFASMVAGGLAGYFGNWCALYFNPDYIARFSIFPGLAILLTVTTSIAAIALQGITLKLAGSITTIGVTAGTIAGLIAVLTTRVETSAAIVAMAVAITVSGASAVANSCLWGLVLSMASIATHRLVEMMLIAIAVAIAIPVAMMGAGAGINAHADGVAIGVAMLSIGSGIYLSRRTLKAHPDCALIYRTAVAIAATGSTRFQSADLTDANFTQINLTCCDLRSTVTTRTQWLNAQLDRARLNHTILIDPDVRNLLVTGHGEGGTYVKCDLKGANLAGANLKNANLTGSDVSDATFEGANLEQANLTQIQALKTNFKHARLTGACIETWNIDSTTQLEGIVCDYVYLLQHHQERSPGSGIFAPGDFAKVYQELTNTVELIFRGNLDLNALESSLSEVRARYPDRHLEVSSLKHRGDGFVIVEVKVSESTNKAEIHSELTQTFELMAKKLEDQFQAVLNSKNDEITFYRQSLFAPSSRTSTTAKLVILKTGQGNLNVGFPVTLKIALEGKSAF